jgi:hypothetical protein
MLHPIRAAVAAPQLEAYCRRHRPGLSISFAFDSQFNPLERHSKPIRRGDFSPHCRFDACDAGAKI